MVEPPKPAPDAGKPGPAPAVKKDSKSMDETTDVKPKKVLKPAPTSGRSLGRAIITASIVVTAGWIVAERFSDRYILQPVQVQENTFMYRLDTISGAVHFCTSAQCVALPIKD